MKWNEVKEKEEEIEEISLVTPHIAQSASEVTDI